MSKLSFSGLHHSTRIIIFSLIAGLGFAALLTFSGTTEAKVRIGELPKDSVAKFPLRMSTGQGISLMDLRGKVAVINFFAVWCGHSRQHIPTMTRFTEEDSKRGLQIVGLAVDDAESTPKRVAEFMQQMKINYPVGMIEDAVFRKFVESKDVSVPQTLIYGRDGRLVAFFSGHDDYVDAQITSIVKRELDKQ